MCVDSNCSQSCVRLLGVETCGCFPGYELASNEIDCSSTYNYDISDCGADFGPVLRSIVVRQVR